jgi:hypothetical protein
MGRTLDTVPSGEAVNEAHQCAASGSDREDEYLGDVGTKAISLAGIEENWGCVECE